MSTAMKKEYSKAMKVLHPNSRKSIAIAKRAKKITNRQKVKMGGFIKQNLLGEKMLWIQKHMLPDVCPYTPELTAELLETYIARNDEELEQINIKRSIGCKRNRQHASRGDVIRMTKERELEEYNTCGIEIPDILNSTQCEMLGKWNGELRYMTNFKFRRFGKQHLQESQQKSSKQPKAKMNETEVKPAGKPENPTEEILSKDIKNLENKSITLSENSESKENSMETE